MKLVEKIANAYYYFGQNMPINTTTHAVGGGEWSIELHTYDNDGKSVFLGELVGSNGTREPANDLWGELSNVIAAAKGLHSVWFGGGFIAK